MDSFFLRQDDSELDEYLSGEPRPPEPAIGPGQIWLVECAAGALSAFHAALLARANVVLYERPLGTALSQALPIGVYAEPLSPTVAPGVAAGPAIARRARYFAADGWSVVQLVERREGRGQPVQFAAECLSQPAGEAPPGLRRRALEQIFTANGLAG